MAEIYANNVKGKLASDIQDDDTSLPLESGHTFPDPGDDWYRATLYRWEFASDGINEYDHEVVKVTDLDGDTLTVEREFEGDTPRAFEAGTPVELRLTAGTLEDALDSVGGDPWLESADDSSITFNDDDQVSQITETVGGDTRTTDYTYNDDGTVDTVTITFRGVERVETYSYDDDGLIDGMTATETDL